MKIEIGENLATAIGIVAVMAMMIVLIIFR